MSRPLRNLHDLPCGHDVVLAGRAVVPALVGLAAALMIQCGTPLGSEASEPTGTAVRFPVVGFVLVGLGAAVLSAAVVMTIRARRKRRRFVPGPWRYDLAVPLPTKPALARSAVARTVAATLRWVTSADTTFDAPRAVAATAGSGGFPVLVSRRMAPSPRCLVLEDAAGGAARWKFLYDEMFAGLIREGVKVDKYTFRANPERCTSEDGRVVSLTTLINCTTSLIVIGNGDAAINPLHGQPAGWLGLLHRVRQRLWINPMPPRCWTKGAFVIAAETRMEHGVTRALLAWHSTDPDAACPRRVKAAAYQDARDLEWDAEGLRKALGDRAFRLVAAVAMVGPPTVAIARWLVEAHSFSLDEYDWLGVVTLPWFLAEQWPDSLRIELQTFLLVEERDLYNSLVLSSNLLFKRSEPAPGSWAHLQWELDKAQRDAHGTRSAPDRLKELTRSPVGARADAVLATLGIRNPRNLRVRMGAATGTALVSLGLLGGGPAVLAKDADCLSATMESSTRLAVSICEREYRKSHTPELGAALADALLANGRIRDSEAVANSLLATSGRPDALRVLGRIATAKRSTEDAIAMFKMARSLHRKSDEIAKIALDDEAWASTLILKDDYKTALLLLNECLMIAHDTHAGPLELRCRLTASDALVHVGRIEAARAQLEVAQPLADSDRKLEQLKYQQGILERESQRIDSQESYSRSAIADFEQARELNKRAQVSRHDGRIELNLAYLLAEQGQLDEATRALEDADHFDRASEFAARRKQVAAKIAYRGGQLDLASRLNEEAYHAINDGDEDGDDDRIDIASLQSRIALIGKDFDSAEHWSQQGIMYAERIRSRQSSLEYRSSVLSVRREPYELLFLTLARAGHDEAALMAFDRWQARSARDASASSSFSIDPNRTGRLDGLEAQLPITSGVTFAEAAQQDAVVSALQTIDFAAFVLADGHVWRLFSTHGQQLQITDLGLAADLQDPFRHLATEPNNLQLGEQLGTRILPEEAFNTPDSLHVLLDGPLATWSLAALRRHGRPLIAIRPIVRLASLPQAGCVARARPGRASVLADAKDEFPHARQEASEVATLLHTTSVSGAAVTANVLFGAKDDSVLHLAIQNDSPITPLPLRTTLTLSDRKVSGIEIVAHKLGPPLVVLSTGSSAWSAAGPDLPGSLALGFLAAGSTQVVATLRPLSDENALRLMTRFYQLGGEMDPVHALAKAQAESAEPAVDLAAGSAARAANTDWPNFVVFGRDTCSTVSALPDHSDPRVMASASVAGPQ